MLDLYALAKGDQRHLQSIARCEHRGVRRRPKIETLCDPDHCDPVVISVNIYPLTAEVGW